MSRRLSKGVWVLCLPMVAILLSGENSFGSAGTSPASTTVGPGSQSREFDSTSISRKSSAGSESGLSQPSSPRNTPPKPRSLLTEALEKNREEREWNKQFEADRRERDAAQLKKRRLIEQNIAAQKNNLETADHTNRQLIEKEAAMNAAREEARRQALFSENQPRGRSSSTVMGSLKHKISDTGKGFLDRFRSKKKADPKPGQQ